jgi:DNA-binding FadR family transcriptional regulator
MRHGLKHPPGLADQISMNTVTTASMPSRIVSPARPGGAQPSPVESHLSTGVPLTAAPEQRALVFPRAAAQRGRGLHGQLVQQLGQMIVAGELGADRPLVPEEIGQRFEVSRTVVRESLRVLEAKGLVSARPNVGTRIRPVHEWNLLDPDVIEWRALGPLRTQQARELVELRLSFEPLAARLVAGRHAELPEGTRARLTELAEILAEASTVGDLPGYHRADAELHALLLRATENRMLEHLACVVFGALEITGVRPYGCAFGAEQDPHAVLVAEVLKGDGAAAADCVSRLLCGLSDDAGQAAGLHVPAQRDR